MPFQDLRSYLASLEQAGLLHRINRSINKDTELMPLVRWQYRGLPESERKGFLFTRVEDARGHRYPSPVAVACLGASRRMLAHAMGCAEAEVRAEWVRRSRSEIAPITVPPDQAPVKEVILTGADLQGDTAGLFGLPIPNSTPGFDPGPYVTAGHWVTRDPETGARNVGICRAMVKGPNLLGVNIVPSQHIGIHWTKARERGRPLAAAVVIGPPPALSLVAPAKLPYGVDELAVAGSLRGAPIEVVRCETVDLEVPAHAEMVLEGYITVDVEEPEAPFGEYTGYVGEQRFKPLFEVTCITHRRNPIWLAFISQFPPSESSSLRSLSNEAVYLELLQKHCGITAVLDVAFIEEAGSAQNLVVVQMKKQDPTEPWRALNAVTTIEASYGKIVIAVDEDIDPRNLESIFWALCTRMQPASDLRVITHRASLMDPSSGPLHTSPPLLWFPPPHGTSAVLIDATRKWDFPPVSLPPRPYMERARELWEELGLPTLAPRGPWYGYPLGAWPADWQQLADLAVAGRYEDVARLLAQHRRPTREGGTDR